MRADRGSSNPKTRSEYALAMGLSRERGGQSQRSMRSLHAQSRSTKLARLLPSHSATIGGSLSSKSLSIEILCNALPNRLGFISL